MRINKYLAECGICSRRKADELVQEGRVSVNKKPVRELGFDVDETKDVVYLDGKKVVRVAHYDYIMFYKPKRCVTTLDDSRDNKSGRPKSDFETENLGAGGAKRDTGDDFASKNKGSRFGLADRDRRVADVVDDSERKARRSITDYFGKELKEKRLFPVGRLDYDSEGLLLLTNDGDLTFGLTHPSNEIPKTYIVKIEGTIEESDLAILRKGVKVGDVKYGKCKVKVTGVEEGFTRLEVVIFEGKNREIRRMFEAVEKNVVFLKRIAIGELRLGGLPRGGYRELSDVEVAYLKGLCANKQDSPRGGSAGAPKATRGGGAKKTSPKQ